MDDAERQLAEVFAEAYDENGVDRTLIRECPAQTPTERLARLEGFINTLSKVRRVATSMNSTSDAPAKQNP